MKNTEVICIYDYLKSEGLYWKILWSYIHDLLILTNLKSSWYSGNLVRSKFSLCVAPQKRAPLYTQCTKNTFFENGNITILSSVTSLTASLVLAHFPNVAGTTDVVWSSIQFLFPACPGKRQWCSCSLRPVSSNACPTSLSRTLYKHSFTALTLWRNGILPWKWQSNTEWSV